MDARRYVFTSWNRELDRIEEDTVCYAIQTDHYSLELMIRFYTRIGFNSERRDAFEEVIVWTDNCYAFGLGHEVKNSYSFKAEKPSLDKVLR